MPQRRHAVCAINYQGKDPADFVDDCYSREKYAACYGYAISAINGVDMWPKPPDGVVEEKILPPLYKRGPGRPKKLRIREFDEDGVRKPRKGKYHCTTCGESDHNTGSCKKPHDPNALKRKRKTSKGKAKDDAASASQDAASASQGPASASQAPAAASQDPAGISQGTASASQVTAAASQAPASASQAPATEASQDLFGDIPDEVMASIPEVMPVKPKKKKLKVAHHQPLYHGQRRRTSVSQATAGVSQVPAAASQGPASVGQVPAAASQGTASASQGTASASQCSARDLLL
ncbi:hypothetical protein P8452_72160 [Trifolium repens]|nr:hypothetical protein P8452_72160 [Trifolium repens]